MRWPWQHVETRAVGYSDDLLAYLTRRAEGDGAVGETTATGALESCAGITGRLFAAADVTATSPTVAAALSPDLLTLIGRSLIRAGELVCFLDVSGDELAIMPAQTHSIAGGPMPSSWEYDVMLAGPTRTQSYTHIPAQRILHFTYSTQAATPFRGNSPLEVAALAGRLSASTIKTLADEAGGPLANLFGVPLPGDDPALEPIRVAIGGAHGGVVFLENGDLGASSGAYVDLVSKRMGPSPPEPFVILAKQASDEVYAACGFNPSLFTSGSADSLQNSWRLALFGVIAPLGRKVVAELNRKLGDGITLEWEELRSSDVQGRARSLGAMVTAGATLESAAAEAGFKNLVAAPMPEVNNVQN